MWSSLYHLSRQDVLWLQTFLKSPGYDCRYPLNRAGVMVGSKHWLSLYRGLQRDCAGYKMLHMLWNKAQAQAILEAYSTED